MHNPFANATAILKRAAIDPEIASFCKSWAVDRLADPLKFTMAEYMVALAVQASPWFGGA